MKRNREQRLSHIDLMILGLLSERPMYGYEINKTISSEEMRVWIDIPMPSIYASLSKLKTRDFVREAAEKEPGKPERGVFHITNKGREVFLNTLSMALGEERQDHISYNIPIFFMNRLSREKVIAGLEQRREFLRSWLASIQEGMSEGRARESSSTLPMVLDHTRRVTETKLKWLDETISSLTSERKVRLPGAVEWAKQPLMALRGNLSDSTLTDTIHMIGMGKRTGILTIKKDHLVRALSFKGGRIAAAASYTMEGKVKRKAAGEGKKPILNDILRTFEWQEGEFVFEEGKLEDEMVPLEITNENLILAGCSLVDDWTKISKIVPSNDIIFDQIESPEEIAASLHLSDEEIKILALANGVRDVNTLAKMGNTSLFEASKILYALVSVGLLTTVGKDKSEAFRLFKHIITQLIDYLETLRAKDIRKIEERFNRTTEKMSVPLRIQGGIVSEDLDSGTAMSQLIIYEKDALKVLIDTTSDYLGKRFAEQAMRSIIDYLPPDLRELFLRYEFTTVFPLRTS